MQKTNKKVRIVETGTGQSQPGSAALQPVDQSADQFQKVGNKPKSIGLSGKPLRKANKRSYIIDLNGPAARGNLKLLALLYPIWGLVLPFYICLLNRRDINVHHLAGPLESPFMVLMYLVLLGFTISILANRLLITPKTIRFGHKPFLSYKTSSLKELDLDRSLTNKETIISFNFEKDGCFESIDAEGMEDRMKGRLMAAVDNLAPHCRIPKNVRSLLGHTTRKASIVKNGARISMPYHSRLFLVQLQERVGTYQQFFWRVWAACFGILTVFLGPIIAALALQKIWYEYFHTTFIESAINVWAEWWRGLYPLVNETLKSSSMVSRYAEDSSHAKILLVVAAILLLFFISYMCRSNRLTISENGLTLSLEWLGITFSSQHIDWSALAAIGITKAGYSSPDDWRINFVSKGNVLGMNLILGAIRTSAQRLELVKAIEKYATDVPVEADVLSALAPPSESSYTELWLSSLASAPQREKLTPLSPGHMLNEGLYTIDKRHGAGGQGVTYLAHKTGERDSRLKLDGEESEAEAADLVIKETILPVFVDSEHRREAVERFELDARLLKRLDHSHLVQLRDYFIEDHRAYLVLDRVRGYNLRQLVENNGALRPAQVLTLARQMCEILSYLHEQTPEIIHRDFTPENLMLDLGDKIKLIDFGVAHELKSRTTATVVGKHAYLPPEQFRGKPTKQSDLYALGATLFFLLTGTDPTPLTKLNPIDFIIAASAERPPIYPISLDSFSEEEREILSVLSTTIEHATELDVLRRTGSAHEVLRELMESPFIAIKEPAQTSEDLADPGHTIKTGPDQNADELSQ